MSCDSDEPARDIVERAIALLDDERIRREIDEPIDSVVETFEYDELEALSLRGFHDSIAEFVRRVYTHGLRCRHDLTREEALAEAIFVLESGYRSARTTGYAGACFDAANAEPSGMPSIIGQMAEWIKARHRDMHNRRILDRCISPSDWASKRRVAAWLSDSLRSVLPPYMARCSPAQLASIWQDLLFAYREAADPLRHIGAVPDALRAAQIPTGDASTPAGTPC
ncbi:MAG: hypothetical protein NTW86_15560 [Candidatus Sumerlaeota bacterium]|nr:hypothetical protein [Candidatus Sumerlaeota bacterium]